MENINETVRLCFEEWFDCPGDLDDFIFYWENFTPVMYGEFDMQI